MLRPPEAGGARNHPPIFEHLHKYSKKQCNSRNNCLIYSCLKYIMSLLAKPQFRALQSPFGGFLRPALLKHPVSCREQLGWLPAAFDRMSK